MTSPALELRGISRRYGNASVLSGLDFAVGPGETVGICGPSGSGKSTLLRMLSGLERPSSGSVWMDGAAVWNMRRRAGRPCLPRPGFVQQVFQDPVGALDPRWPIWRSITEPLTARSGAPRPRRAVRRSRASEALETVGLGHISADARPLELSVGQCQRIAVLRATIARPAVILADEPTSALDSMNIQGVLRLLRGAVAAETALVVVSHDPRVLRALCHRTLTMRDGQLIEAQGA